MGLILLRPSWEQQPQIAARFNPRWGLKPEFLWSGAAPGVDYAGRSPFARGASLSNVAGLIGRAVRFTPNTTNAFTRTGGNASAQTAFTAVSVFFWQDGASNNFPQLLGTSASNTGFRVGSTGQGNIGSTTQIQLVKGGVAAFNDVTMTGGVPYVLVTSHRQDTGEYYLLLRSLLDGSILRASQTQTSASSAGDGTYGVGIARTDFSGSWSGDIALAFASFTFLPESAGRELLANPWRLFEPRRIWVPGSSAVTHTTTGALTADAATIASTSDHFTLHTTTGALAAGAATVSGAAVHPHTAAGALAAAAATVAGTAAHLTLHTSTGVLEAGAATVAGDAIHTAAAGSHAATGAPAAGAATVSGAAVHLTLHTTTGALIAGEATVHGEATGPNVVHYGNLGWRPEKFGARKRRWEVEGLRQELADAINGVAPPSAPKSTPTKIYVPAAASPALETALLRTRKAAASPAISEEITALRAAIDTARVEAKRQARRRKQQEQLLLM